MDLYHKRKKVLEEKYGKLIILKQFNDERAPASRRGIVDNKQQKYIKQMADISDEEGLKRAHETKYGLYQHYNILFIAGTRDFPQDRIDDLKLPFDDTLNITKMGRDADMYYRSHHETDTVIGHSLGGAVALSLEKQYKKEGNNPFGIVQSKTFGSPTVSGNITSPVLKDIVKNEIVGAGAAGGLAIGASADSAIGFSDGGILTGMGADIGKKVSSDFANRITEDINTSPDRIRYFGDPVSMLDFNSTTVMPSMGFRWEIAHILIRDYRYVADKVPLHDAMKNTLTSSPDDSNAEVLTE